MKREIRNLIALRLLRWGFDVLPDSEFKSEFAKFMLINLKKL